MEYDPARDAGTALAEPEAFPSPAAGRLGSDPGGLVEANHRRVLMVVESCGGGVGRHVFDLAQGLIARGWDVHLAYSPVRAERAFLRRLTATPGLAAFACPMRRGPHPSDLLALRSLRRYLRDAGPFDLIHGHSSKGGALARLAAIGGDLGVVYTPHALITMDPRLSRMKRSAYSAAERVLARLSDRIITVSPAERRHGVALGLEGRRIVAIPNGLTPASSMPRAVVRDRLGLADDVPVIGFVGRLVEQKAPGVLLRALALVDREVRSCQLVIVGDGPLQVPLRRLAETLGIGDRVLWLGDRDGRPLLPAFDVFALPSRYEGLPYVALEALAAGLPIVATDAAGVGLLVRDGRNGRIVPPDSPDRLASALVEFLADPRRRASAEQFARHRAARFTAERMVDRTIATYRDCVRVERPTAWSPAAAPMVPDRGGLIWGMGR